MVKKNSNHPMCVFLMLLSVNVSNKKKSETCNKANRNKTNWSCEMQPGLEKTESLTDLGLVR